MRSFSAEIQKFYRKQRGWSQQRLADRAGLSLSMLAAIERGERRPGCDLLTRLADALQVSLDSLCPEAGKQVTHPQEGVN
ncbi:MAG: hypothetical protein A2284_05995 [Deltaproteobacteria bacterium RIFOXYA12_FULL_61_11]|nr:MAG: hypothetical protein A2284_05995 [Deltaproteobacteria bacterium RIFOXYA12_FULL_61_11]